MNKTQFHTLAKLYGQRYGTFTMQNETIEMWWSKLKKLDHDQVREVFHQLLGEKEKPWGWGKVFEMIEARFPSDRKQVDLEEKWRSDWSPWSATESESQREFGAYIRDMIDENKERTRKKLEPLDWVSACATKLVQIYGRSEASEIARKIQGSVGNTDHELRFLKAVRKELA